MRRVLTCLLAALALTAAACGDNEESPGVGGDDQAAETTATTGDGGEGSGCRDAEEPAAREVKERKAPAFRPERGKTYTAVLETSCGTVEIRLATSRAPKTTGSFISLVRDGFYDGLSFHRIVTGFVVQGGDPQGTGEGGPGYSVTEAPPDDLRYTKGVVAMAKTELEDPGTSGSQFFIVTGDDAGLPPDYALVGRVSKGMDVVERLDRLPNDPADNRPLEPVVIEKATIRER
jgi:peptidyl-prolyl cis-trans isomerase B (cyclophilin B)